MKTTLATWEDDVHHRQIQFSVDYAIENGAIEIKRVIPNKVTVVCEKSNSFTASLPAWSQASRDYLFESFRNSKDYELLAHAVAGPNADAMYRQVNVRQEIEMF